jgi:ribosome-associated protein
MPKKSRKGYYVKGEFVAAGSEADRELRAELHDEDAPSRTARKKASEDLQNLGEELIDMSRAVLAGLDLPDDLEAAIVAARSITSFGARRRQMQLIGKLMRRLDADAVAAVHAALRVERGKAAAGVQLFHEAEQWRDALVEHDERLEQWIELFPGSDIQQLRSLIRQARKDARTSVPGGNARRGRAYRQIFALVRAQLETRRQAT